MWRDLSAFTVHFVREGERPAYDVTISILSMQSIRGGGPFGAARGLARPDFTQRSACFSELPLDGLDRLVTRRGRYGIGFNQLTLLKYGGGHVWQVERDSATAFAIRALRDEKVGPPMDTASPFWHIAPFIDFPGAGGTKYRFEWEREWRVPGDLTFEVDDVAFLFLPEEFHERARFFFATVQRDNSGPVYTCPLADPAWPGDRVHDALRDLF